MKRILPITTLCVLFFTAVKSQNSLDYLNQHKEDFVFVYYEGITPEEYRNHTKNFTESSIQLIGKSSSMNVDWKDLTDIARTQFPRPSNFGKTTMPAIGFKSVSGQLFALVPKIGTDFTGLLNSLRTVAANSGATLSKFDGNTLRPSLTEIPDNDPKITELNTLLKKTIGQKTEYEIDEEAAGESYKQIVKNELYWQKQECSHVQTSSSYISGWTSNMPEMFFASKIPWYALRSIDVYEVPNNEDLNFLQINFSELVQNNKYTVKIGLAGTKEKYVEREDFVEEDYLTPAVGIYIMAEDAEKIKQLITALSQMDKTMYE